MPPVCDYHRGLLLHFKISHRNGGGAATGQDRPASMKQFENVL